MSDTISQRMVLDRETLQQHGHGGLDDLHTELDKAPLHDAARENDLEALQAIVERDGMEQIHTLDKYGLTALHWAAERGNAACAQHLIANGAAVNAVEKRLFRRVPLHFAAVASSLDVVLLLLENGADAQSVEYRGWSAYHFAAYADSVDIMRALEVRGSDSLARTNAGETALHIAAKRGKEAVVGHLLATSYTSSEQLLQTESSSQTALELAKAAGHTEVWRVLEEAVEAASRAKAEKPMRVEARRGSGLGSISTDAASAPAS